MAKTHKPELPGPNLDSRTFQLPTGYTADDGRHGQQKPFTSTRSATHRGKKIKIRTTYRIDIDGEPVTLKTMVMDDGTVHCHGLPNYAFPSAIDLARAIIDASALAPAERDELGRDQGEYDDQHDGGQTDNHDENGGHP